MGYPISAFGANRFAALLPHSVAWRRFASNLRAGSIPAERASYVCRWRARLAPKLNSSDRRAALYVADARSHQECPPSSFEPLHCVDRCLIEDMFALPQHSLPPPTIGGSVTVFIPANRRPSKRKKQSMKTVAQAACRLTLKGGSKSPSNQLDCDISSLKQALTFC